MTTRQHGFTLVEMAIVLTMLGILDLIAIPSMQGPIVQKQVQAGLPLADVLKPPLSAAWAMALPFPPDNATAGLPSANLIVGNYVTSVALQDGAINITYGNQASKAIQGKILSVRPAVVPNTNIVPIAWICGNAAVPDKMTVVGTNATNIPDNLLPLACRGFGAKT